MTLRKWLVISQNKEVTNHFQRVLETPEAGHIPSSFTWPGAEAALSRKACCSQPWEEGAPFFFVGPKNRPNCFFTAKTYVLPATARKRVPETSKKRGRRSKNALPSPPGPTPASCSIPPSWSAATFPGYHQHNPKSKPDKPASDAPDSQLQANLNPRNPTPKP